MKHNDLLTRQRQVLDKKHLSFLFIVIISAIYIGYFVNLDYFYDWDTINVATSIKNTDDFLGTERALHPFFPQLLKPFGFDPLVSMKILEFLFGLSFIILMFKFAYGQTKDYKFSLLIALFILFNFGLTFDMAALEEHIWMYAFLSLFTIFLVKEKWAISAFFLSIAILVNISTQTFILMFLAYAALKLNLFKYENIKEKFLSLTRKDLLQKYIIVIISFFGPLLSVLIYLLYYKNLSLYDIANVLMVSDLHHNPEHWYFVSDRTFLEQMQLAYYGLVSVFISRYPDFPQTMPTAPYFGLIFLPMIIYTVMKGISFNHKTLCVLPTFIVLSVHSLFFESWDIQRWDFLPFFFVYFLITGYSAKNEIKNKNITGYSAKNEIKNKNITNKNITGYSVKNEIKNKNIKGLLLIIIIVSVIFTFNSFNTMSNFQKNPIYVYADKVSQLLDNNSVVLESLRQNSEFGLYMKYKCDNKIIFIGDGQDIGNAFATKKIYASYNTYYYLVNNKIPVDGRIVWQNNMFSIIELKLKI